MYPSPLRRPMIRKPHSLSPSTKYTTTQYFPIYNSPSALRLLLHLLLHLQPSNLHLHSPAKKNPPYYPLPLPKRHIHSLPHPPLPSPPYTPPLLPLPLLPYDPKPLLKQRPLPLPLQPLVALIIRLPQHTIRRDREDEEPDEAEEDTELGVGSRMDDGEGGL